MVVTNRTIIDPLAYRESEQAFNHAERNQIVLPSRNTVRASIRCNQLIGRRMCEWSDMIEYHAVDIEMQIRNRLINHIRRTHRTIDAVATADRRWVTLRDIGG